MELLLAVCDAQMKPARQLLRSEQAVNAHLLA
jgi:hypothetical protein